MNEHSKSLTTLIAKIEEIDSQVNSAQQKIAEASSKRSSLDESVRKQLTTIIESAQAHHEIAVERALSPEQLAWSILRSTGVLQSYVQNKSAELEKQSPLPQDADEATRRARVLQATRAAMTELQGNVNVFVSLYSSGVGQTSDEFFASPDQALFVSNGGAVFAWAAPNGSNLASQVISASNSQDASKLMYRHLLTREPTDVEMAFISEEIAKAGDAKNAVIQELIWGILASAEYRFYP